MRHIRRHVQQIRDAEPGTRFMEVYERSHVRSIAVRALLLVLGLLLLIAAAVTFWLPGPNWVLVVLGLGIICGQSQWVARTLDRGELGLKTWHDRHWAPYRHKRALLTALTLLTIAVVALIGWYAWRHDWIHHSWLPGLD